MGLTRSWIEKAGELIEEASRALDREPEKAVTLIGEAKGLLRAAEGRIREAYGLARASFPLILVLLLLTSFSLASMFWEEARPAASAACLVALGLLVYLTYPGMSEVSADEVMAGLYVGFLVFALLLLAPHLLEGITSESGLPLTAAIAAALSMAARNLRRRPLRTGLALSSIACMALALAAFSSATIYVSARELVTAVAVPPGSLSVAVAIGSFNLAHLH